MAAGGAIRFDGQVAVVTGAGRGLGAAYARVLASRGAAVKLPEDKLASEFVSTVLGLARDSSRLGMMGQAATQLARPDAAKRIGDLMLAYAK